METFDKHAEGYDRQWERLAPLMLGLHTLTSALFAELPDDARVLVVGAGTGAEILWLAGRNPGWRFTAVDPSEGMLAILRRRAEEAGILDRIELHHGYVESLSAAEPHDAATSILVSQFILDRAARRAYFRAIGERLRPGSPLVSADLAADMHAPATRHLLEVWLRITMAGAVPFDALERAHGAYTRDVAVVPADEVAAIIAEAGFDAPMRFFQAALITGWYARWGV